MKVILIVYAIIGMIVQLSIGQLTGFGQGSIGLLTFAFLVEVDPRFRFKFLIPNIKERRRIDKEKGDQL